MKKIWIGLITIIITVMLMILSNLYLKGIFINFGWHFQEYWSGKLGFPFSFGATRSCVGICISIIPDINYYAVIFNIIFWILIAIIIYFILKKLFYKKTK